MKFKKRHLTEQQIEEIELRRMNKDPLAKLNKSRTKHLENLFMLSPEENSEIFEQEMEQIEIQTFLTHAIV